VQPITIWRRITQVAFLGLTGTWLTFGWLRCPYGVPFVSCQSCPSTDCPGRYLQPWVVGLIALSAVFSGRVFCGWACPMGLIQDALCRVPKLPATCRPPFGRVDGYLKYLKYVALVVVVLLIFTHNLQWARPYEYVTRSPSLWNLEAVSVAWNLGGGAYKIRFGILAIAIIGALFVKRFFCRYMCPLGALLGVFNKMSVFGLRRAQSQCDHCGKYPRECITYTVPDTTECVMCGECVQGCPTKAISYGLRSRNPTAPNH
jgi:ferredoxin-type protein NapH